MTPEDPAHRPEGAALRLALLVVLVLLAAGCLGDDIADPGPDRDETFWARVEAEPHRPVLFRVEDRLGGPVDVAGYAWSPPEPSDTVVLVVHGGGGLALRQFGPAPAPGYSLAHRILATDRVIVVVDRPGYGDSDEPGPGHTLDDDAWILSRVAEELRRGGDAGLGPHRHVVALGHSIGAYVVMVAQGEYEAFDAIVPAAWTHAGFRDGAPQGCLQEFRVECILHPPNVDARILDLGSQAIEEKENDPLASGLDFLLSTGVWRSAHPALRDAEAVPDRDDLPAAKVAVPVLMLQGLEDGMSEPTTRDEEEAVFTSTEDLTVLHFEATAHWVFHHLDRDDVYAEILGWLDARGL